MEMPWRNTKLTPLSQQPGWNIWKTDFWSAHTKLHHPHVAWLLLRDGGLLDSGTHSCLKTWLRLRSLTMFGSERWVWWMRSMSGNVEISGKWNWEIFWRKWPIDLQLTGKHGRTKQVDAHEGQENSRDHSWTWWRMGVSSMNKSWKWWTLTWRNKAVTRSTLVGTLDQRTKGLDW